MILNLENIAGHQKAFLTIKGHQTNCWKQIRKSVRDAFTKYQENEHLIYYMYVLCFTSMFGKLHPYECGYVSECYTWMMIREFLKVF